MKHLIIGLALLVGSSAWAEVQCVTEGAMTQLQVKITAESELQLKGNSLILEASGLALYRFKLEADIIRLDKDLIEFSFEEVDSALGGGVAGTLLLFTENGSSQGSVKFSRLPIDRHARDQYALSDCKGQL